ncbi:MAG: ABC transporter permease [candidate division Zixibacteria bacterium]|nr:ABC transporter permease [candidate division Zixibacteria bacterium]
MINFNEKIQKVLIDVYEYFLFLLNATRAVFGRPLYTKEVIEQLYQTGYRSISIVSLTGFFTGMVLAFQTGNELSRFGAKAYIGGVVAVSLVRELGPVLTALVVAGRVGAGITAELGSMKVTDQIDAMRAMATDPYKKLVVTRMLALLIMMPVLTVLSDVVGLIGGMVIAVTNLNVGFELYKSTVMNALLVEDLISGLMKPVFFGMLVSSVGCFLGMNTSGGTKGVGSATTMSVVISSIFVLVLDFILTKLTFLMGKPI